MIDKISDKALSTISTEITALIEEELTRLGKDIEYKQDRSYADIEECIIRYLNENPLIGNTPYTVTGVKPGSSQKLADGRIAYNLELSIRE